MDKELQRPSLFLIEELEGSSLSCRVWRCVRQHSGSHQDLRLAGSEHDPYTAGTSHRSGLEKANPVHITFFNCSSKISVP